MKTMMAFLICATAGIVVAQDTQEAPNVSALFQQLQHPETTDQAACQLTKTAKADPEARKYLAVVLPPLIEQGPKKRRVWSNAASLAGDLKIIEAISALAKWIGQDVGAGVISLSQSSRLTDYPSGRALVQIGDPAIPALNHVLTNRDLRERTNAVYALKLIGSSGARKALQEHVSGEPDPNLRDFIVTVLDKWISAPAESKPR